MTTNTHQLKRSDTVLPEQAQTLDQAADERALQQLQELGIKDVDQALRAFQEDERAFNGRLKSAIIHGVLTFPLIVLSWYIIGWLKSYAAIIGWANWIVLATWLSYLGKGLWITDKQQHIASVLQHFNDPRSVGPLIEWLSHMDDDEELEETWEAVMKRVAELLPTVESAEVSGLTTGRLDWLAQSISKDSPEWSLAILQAMSKFGNEINAKSIRQVLKWPDSIASYTELQQAAEIALQQIMERAEQTRLRTSLLRPAEPSNEDTLLRPAANSESDPNSLLRPITNEVS
jgi:hypothetical protein